MIVNCHRMSFAQNTVGENASLNTTPTASLLKMARSNGITHGKTIWFFRYPNPLK